MKENSVPAESFGFIFTAEMATIFGKEKKILEMRKNVEGDKILFIEGTQENFQIKFS